MGKTIVNRYTSLLILLAMCYSSAVVAQDAAQTAIIAKEVTAAIKREAEQGNLIAQNALAEMYVRGEGVAENDAEAVKWFIRAANQGDATAQWALGAMYGSGRAFLKAK
jgi:TPR repeat protein